MKLISSLIGVLLLLLVFPLQGQCQNIKSTQTASFEVKKMAISDSLSIAYIDEGEMDNGTTLLFIHGLGSNLKAWQKNIDSLKKHVRCIGIDLPGYGESGTGAYAYDMSFFAESVSAFIEKMALEKVVLVGHSMGGQIAMHLALDSPQKVEKLVLIAPAGFEVFSEQEKSWFQSFFTPAVVKATPPAQIEKNVQVNFYKMPADAEFMIEERLGFLKSDAFDAYCTMIPRCVMGMLNEPVFDRLPEIKVPTLVIFGENDMLIPNKLLHPALTTLEVAKGGQEQIPNSSLVLIPEAGHFVQWEGARQVNQRLLEFLR